MSAQDSGIICMSITPFAMDGGLDEEAMRAHLGRMAAAEVGVVLGSLGTGEGHLLREAEIDRLYEIGVEELKGKVPVYGGAITFSGTDRMIEQARRGAASGLDAVQVYPPRRGLRGCCPRSWRPSAIIPTCWTPSGALSSSLSTPLSSHARSPSLSSADWWIATRRSSASTALTATGITSRSS